MWLPITITWLAIPGQLARFPWPVFQFERIRVPVQVQQGVSGQREATPDYHRRFSFKLRDFTQVSYATYPTTDLGTMKLAAYRPRIDLGLLLQIGVRRQATAESSELGLHDILDR